MGGSSLKRVLFWKKKKKSPLSNAFKDLKRALPKKKKSKKKGILKTLNLDKVKRDKRSKKKSILTRDKKAPKSLKVLALGKERKQSDPNTAEGRREKDKEELARLGEKIKNTFSLEKKKEPSPEPEIAPLKETNERKPSLQKLKDFMKPRRLSEPKAN